MSNPIKVLFYRVSGLSKDDIRTYCKNQIDKQFDSQVSSNYYFEEFEGITYCEIQEGGTSECYLSDTIKQLTQNDVKEIYIPTGTRLVKATYEPASGINFLLMNEGFILPDDALLAKKTNLMKPYYSDSRVFFNVSLFMAVTSFMFAMVSTVLVISATQVPVVAPTVKNDQFESFHNVMRQAENLPEDRYVDRIVFDNNSWRLFQQRKEVKVLEDELTEEEKMEKVMEVFTPPVIKVDNNEGEENE